MELDWTTVILEAINFLVLVWLLKRFFYRPVLEVIARRQAASEKIVSDAAALKDEAGALKAQYDGLLAAADLGGQQAFARLDEEIANERTRRLAAVEAEAEADRARRQMLEERARAAQSARLELEAAALAGRFAGQLLDRLAGPELEALLIDLALAELTTGANHKLAPLADALKSPATGVSVLTAFALEGGQQQRLVAALEQLAGRHVPVEFGRDETLKSGLCLTAGAWVLRANLRDELAFFAGAPDET